MAHAAAITRTAGDLITALTGRQTGDTSWLRTRDLTVRALREQPHARANQFDVKARLDGLVEKFLIRNREDLSEALETRLDELSSASSWLPEILAFLLALSDRPVDKTDLSTLDTLAPSNSARADLTWDDILAADPLSEDELWENIDRGHHSSGDDSGEEEESEEASDRAVSTEASSVDGDACRDSVRSVLSRPRYGVVADIRKARQATSSASQENDSHAFTELAIIRETLMMLHGLPTDLYDLYAFDGEANHVSLSTAVKLDGASQKSTLDLLRQMIEAGSSLNYLRDWTMSVQSSAYRQSIQVAVRARLGHLNTQLYEIESRHLSPRQGTVVSAIAARNRVDVLVRPFIRLSSLIKSSSQPVDRTYFPLLDNLYDGICIARASGDEVVFELFRSIFMAGLKTYTRLVADWINSGSLDSRDKDVFFVRDADVGCDRGALWHNRFVMHSSATGKPYAPRCLQSCASDIFALGKSKYFLLMLDPNHAHGHSDASASLPAFDDLDQSCISNSMVPFAQLLDESVRSWLARSRSSYATLVKSSLLQEHNLARALDALPEVFFAKNGATFQALAEALLNNLTSHSRADLRGDTFLLSAMTCETLGSSPRIDADELTARMLSTDSAHTAISLTRTLGRFQLSYAFAWPAQNITRCRSSETHGRVLALLLQLYYSKSKLDEKFAELRHDSSIASVALRLRQRLRALVEIIQSHVTTTAYDLHDTMIADMGSALSVDAMVNVWTAYEKGLLINLLLATNLHPIRDAVISILELSETLTQAKEPAEVAGLQSQFERHTSFLAAGVRSLSRTEGAVWLGAFAERLHWIVS